MADALKRFTALNNKPTKKAFKPNLNVVRKKHIANEFVIKPDVTVRPERKRILSKHQAAKYITTSGIFSEDTPEIKKQHNASLITYEHEASSISKPKLTIRAKKVSKKEEDGVVNNLLDYDQDVKPDIKMEHQPVLLPLTHNKDGFFSNISMKHPIREESQFNPFTFNKEVFSDDNLAYTLIRLPDCLPGKRFDPDGNATDCTLAHLEEGQIGKIRIRKSGRMEMVMGSMTYDIEQALSPPYKEDLMCVPHPEAKDEPKMVNLGTLTEKFILTPCWDQLLGGKES